jgi:uncharacterized membrane-anchored protein YhcB (DUF1043 family)
MNNLILIGNGFDLAHGLKTSYSDFLLWYLKNSLNKLHSRTQYEDELIILKSDRTHSGFDLKSLDQFKDYLRHFNINYELKNKFLENLIEQTIQYRWVDIENQYYLSLIKIYKILEINNVENSDSVNRKLKELNDSFDPIRMKLEEYLKTMNNKLNAENPEISGHFNHYLNTGYDSKKSDENLFLNFNYTSTIELYKSNFFHDSQFQVNYIHGRLDDVNNPIIFGYGDEKDTYFEKIERLNNNEFLKNIKSFNYLKTRNYLNFLRFIESNPFDVCIMGHSCGLSDRILLQTIFEHPNCRYLKIFYYQKSKDENDFTEKTQEISRHFSDKSKMRKKIINFQDCVPLTTHQSDEVGAFSSN